MLQELVSQVTQEVVVLQELVSQYHSGGERNDHHIMILLSRNHPQWIRETRRQYHFELLRSFVHFYFYNRDRKTISEVNYSNSRF